ncbi:D-serine ammonia-lyase [Kurthia sibirica]|uniref:Probable D-serine dehydratase n=1 Tax=Kurthia sibirica TaxID=202750 RepID=A0A2U3ALU7_9BACL|nr:D-serine ammonia-lyase [Kurthia sibirica]PWI25477.1 D-serine ammonia-lyase [Kurthia sibirica]GEK33954.1 putative D-serine dehydratase [Kurthia sibirica]
MTLIDLLTLAQPIYWKNPQKIKWLEAKEQLSIDDTIIDDAEKRLQRFAPYFLHTAPETAHNQGLIESPLQQLNRFNHAPFANDQKLLIKRDDILPISGSIKARGGIYEVLTLAEEIAGKHGLIDDTKDYRQFAELKFKELLSSYTIVVGSTGNLGLSIGIMSAQLGFKVVIHMSNDAKQWKKDLLRQKGAIVIEHRGDYGEAVKRGRKEVEEQERALFIDDENSIALFSGYAVAARRLQHQLQQQSIDVSIDNKLAVYLPCGVGGGPGGVAFGLKTIYGDAVECYFVEPVQSPCMLLGMSTGQHHDISVNDIGLSNKTAADGLAVGRASKFVGQLMTPLLEGIYTVEDTMLFKQLRALYMEENIKLEPSAAAALNGPQMTGSKAKTHIIWATGGGMVPASIWQQYFEGGA